MTGVQTCALPIYLIGKMSGQTIGILNEFLEEKFIFWLEVLSVTGAVRHAVDALEEIVKWLDVRYTSSSVDFQKFIGLSLLGLADSIPCQGLLSFRPHIF